MIKDIDPERMNRLIGSMREAVANLSELGDLPEVEFLQDKHKQSSAKYNFIVAIEAAIDLASHVISRKGFRPPEDYADSFKVLSEAGVLEPGFTAELEKMARSRNRLVVRQRTIQQIASATWKLADDKQGGRPGPWTQ